MKKRNDGVYHFDAGDYVDYFRKDEIPWSVITAGAGGTPYAAPSMNWTIDQYREFFGLAPSSPSSREPQAIPPLLPVFIGQPNLNLPGDSGGKAPGEAAYASEQDVISQLQNIWGIDQAAAQQKYYDMIGKPVPAVSQSPVEPQFSAKDILDYLSQPGKTDIEIAQAMQSTGVSPAQVAQATGMPEAEVQQRYNDALAAASGTTMTSPSGATTVPTLGTGTLNTVQGVLNNAGRVVGGAMDTLFDILGIPKPSYTVVQPRMPGGTVVWGQPSGSVFGRVGTTPGGTVVGVQTGIPVLDVLIGKAADIISGRVNANDAISAADIEKIIVETARGELGIPDLTDPQDIINKVVDLQKGVGADDSQSVIDLTKGPISAEADKTPSGGDRVTSVSDRPPAQTDKAPGAAAPSWETIRAATDKAPSVVDTEVTGRDTTSGRTVDSPSSSGDKAVSVGAGSGSVGLGEGSSGVGMGIRGEQTEKAGVVELEDLFNLDEFSLAQVLNELAGNRDNTGAVPYYGGGDVRKSAGVDELIRLLRG